MTCLTRRPAASSSGPFEPFAYRTLADPPGGAALNGGTHGFTKLKQAVTWRVPAASTSDLRRLLNKLARDALIQQVGERFTRA
jgi:hypothetical protein